MKAINGTYFVTCVTKKVLRDRNDLESFSDPKWHTPVSGTAKVVDGIVEFHGMRGKLAGTRPGLDGTALTLEVLMPNSYLDVLWDLYTDTPMEGSNSTPEEIRERAKRASSRW